jgi:predicted lipoprotein with Yx(FWY)xxD motif
MRVRSGVVVLSVASAALLAVSSWSASAAFGTPRQAPKNAVVFRAQHVAGVKGLVLLEGPGLVVYTFTGDKRGKPGTCIKECAAIWPPVRGVPEVAHGTKIPGKFGRIHGQVTYNGWPLYLFTGEKSHKNHADSAFKVVRVSAPSKKPVPTPTPTPNW